MNSQIASGSANLLPLYHISHRLSPSKGALCVHWNFNVISHPIRMSLRAWHTLTPGHKAPEISQRSSAPTVFHPFSQILSGEHFTTWEEYLWFKNSGDSNSVASVYLGVRETWTVVLQIKSHIVYEMGIYHLFTTRKDWIGNIPLIIKTLKTSLYINGLLIFLTLCVSVFHVLSDSATIWITVFIPHIHHNYVIYIQAGGHGAGLYDVHSGPFMGLCGEQYWNKMRW